MENQDRVIKSLQEKVKYLEKRVISLEAERDTYKAICERFFADVLENDAARTEQRQAQQTEKQAGSVAWQMNAKMKGMKVGDLDLPVSDPAWTPVKRFLGFWATRGNELADVPLLELKEKIPSLLALNGLGIGKASAICKSLNRAGISVKTWEYELRKATYTE